MHESSIVYDVILFGLISKSTHYIASFLAISREGGGSAPAEAGNARLSKVCTEDLPGIVGMVQLDAMEIDSAVRGKLRKGMARWPGRPNPHNQVEIKNRVSVCV